MSDLVDTVSLQLAAGQIPANLNGSVTFHPEGHVNLFMSEPLVYTNPHIWAAYLFTMLGLGIAALYLFFRHRSERIKIMVNDSGTLPEANSEPVDMPLSEEEAVFRRLKLKYDLLVQRIELLDQNYDSGRLSLDEYAEAREHHKQLLAQVRQQLEEYIQ